MSEARWVGDHPEDLSRPVTIGDDCWIGYGAVILSGVTIGRSTIVAAGSVVTSDVPENAVVAGTPARVVKQRFTPDDYAAHWASIDARRE
ncbi:DapH/DapD/GlmU-related protein [Geodermatophilus ruber]|uniref:DapH/DapD/GlmU-related protein n=1 Tax=Geodermatophilus ruber TaxID=504800 RepID=UPI003CCB7E9A